MTSLKASITSTRASAPSMQLGWGGEERTPAYLRLHDDGVEASTVEVGQAIEWNGRPAPVAEVAHLADGTMSLLVGHPESVTDDGFGMTARYLLPTDKVLVAPSADIPTDDNLRPGLEFWHAGEWHLITEVVPTDEHKPWGPARVRLDGQQTAVDVWPTGSVCTREVTA